MVDITLEVDVSSYLRPRAVQLAHRTLVAVAVRGGMTKAVAAQNERAGKHGYCRDGALEIGSVAVGCEWPNWPLLRSGNEGLDIIRARMATTWDTGKNGHV